MDLQDLPFKIGMQYENWEFDLEPVEFEGFNVKYRYIKDDIPTILGGEVEEIQLYFNFDILYKIKILFKPRGQINMFSISN